MATKVIVERTRISIDRATLHDVSGIHSLLVSQKKNTNVLQHSRKDIQSNIRDYLVATDEKGRVLGCTSVHFHTPKLGEESSLVVAATALGKGVGPRLIEESQALAVERGAESTFLLTQNPEYFERLGYKRISRFALPRAAFLAKVRHALEQPPSRWLPMLLWRFTIMEKRYTAGKK